MSLLLEGLVHNLMIGSQCRGLQQSRSVPRFDPPESPHAHNYSF